LTFRADYGIIMASGGGTEKEIEAMSKAVAFWTEEAAEAAGYELWAESVPCCVYPSGLTVDLELWEGPDGRKYSCYFNDSKRCFVFWPCYMDEGEDPDGDRYEWAEEPGLGPCYEIDLEEAEE
jgi:hypothetical protein